MDALEGPRRFSAASPLITAHNHPKADEYGTLADVSELEAVLSNGETDVHTTIRQEARLLFKYSVPLTITSLLQYSFSLVTIFVVGHIGTDELGAVSLATMTASITGYAVYEGLATCLDTLCSQAYGSGRKELVGLQLQRMVILMFLVTLPIGAIWICSGWILAAIVPERDLAILAGSYLRILIASCPGFFLFEAGKRFTQAQGIFNASLFVLLIATPLNMILNYIFVFTLGWGLHGAALSTVIANTSLPILLWVYVYFLCPSTLECWGGFTRSALTNWGPMLKLAIPGIVMIEAEWLAFDILTFSSSYLSTAHLAAQSVVMTICIVMFHIPFSVSIAVSTRLGNLIGAGSLRAARIATRAYIIIFGIMSVVNATLIGSLHNVLPKAFSDDPEVIRIATSAMPVIAAFQICDSTTALVNAILRGLGGQTIGGYANLFVYYVIAVPLALFLCFGRPNLELAGLWIGCTVGSGLITVSEGIYCKMASWQKAVDKAKERDD